MKIEKIKQFTELEHKHKKVDSIREILNRIFEISLHDPGFSMNSRIDSLNLEILEIKKKLKTQRELLLRSKTVNEKMDSRLENLEDGNFKIKVQLLEKMGSEL